MEVDVYDQVVQAVAELIRALADQLAGVESLWVRHEHESNHASADGEDDGDPFEVAREWSLVLASGLVISVRARWYDVNAEGWAPGQQLIYDRMDAQDTP